MYCFMQLVFLCKFVFLKSKGQCKVILYTVALLISASRVCRVSNIDALFGLRSLNTFLFDQQMISA